MNRIAAALFAFCVLAGTLLDRKTLPAAPGGGVLVADLHVHPYPGDGSLPVWELQREAARRGVDVIAVTGHNNRVGLQVGRLVPLDPNGPIVLPGQELTTPRFHMVAVGIQTLIDWKLTAEEAIAAIHAQGGVAIAAHPLPLSWRDDGDAGLRALDGAEVAHPSSLVYSPGRQQLQRFFRRVQAVNPGVAPIGSTDFHMTAPLGLCRTYVLTGERSAAAVLDAVRQGRTVARDGTGRLFGTPEHVAMVEAYLAARVPVAPVSRASKLAALGALVALAGLTVTTRPAR